MLLIMDPVSPEIPAGVSRDLVEILREGLLSQGGLLRGRITSGSMRPMLEAGDEVVVEGCDSLAVRAGELILLARDGGWVVHRILARRTQEGRRELLEKGDADAVARWVSAETCRGRVLSVVKGDRRLELGGASGRLFGGTLACIARLVARESPREPAGHPGIPNWVLGMSRWIVGLWFWVGSTREPK